MTTETKYYRVTLCAKVTVDYETDASTPEEAKEQAIHWTEGYLEGQGVDCLGEPCTVEVEDIEERVGTEEEGYEWI